MKKPADYVALSNFVIDHGARGQCFGCKSFLYETALVSGQPYCRPCVLNKFPNNFTAKFEKSDAKFRCQRQCGAENLSFDQFIIGTCCEEAFRWSGTLTFYKMTLLNKIYAESRDEEGKAEDKVETADETVATCRKALEDAEICAKNARDELDEKKKWRRKIQTRAQFITSIEMKKDNPNKDNEQGVDNKVQNSDERNDTSIEGQTCTVCFEIYAEGDRQKSVIIPCGHQACFGCLSSLPEKSCPTCRAQFTNDKVFKLYPSTQN